MVTEFVWCTQRQIELGMRINAGLTTRLTRAIALVLTVRPDMVSLLDLDSAEWVQQIRKVRIRDGRPLPVGPATPPNPPLIRGDGSRQPFRGLTPSPFSENYGREPLVAIGSSTGGPNALADVLASLPKDFDAAVVIVQHIDAAFAPGLAHWLAEHSGRRVTLARPGDRPSAGRVLIAGTNDHVVMDPDQTLRYTDQPRDLSYRPSVDVFFKTLAANWPGTGVAALLTGMGRDGAAGLLGLKNAGWTTIAQDEASSVIWGMPRAAVELQAASLVLPVSEIGAAVARLSSRR